jgi:hypothetical protein
VDALGAQYPAITDSEGVWRISALAPGLYKLHIEAEGFAPIDSEEQVVAGEVTEIKFRILTEATEDEVVIRGTRPPLLRERIARAGASCWLVNTGWTGGAYGTGRRMPIAATRALLAAALDGALGFGGFRRDPNFGFEVTVAAPGVAPGLLNPRATWSDPAAYDAQASRLVGMFVDNFAQCEAHVGDDVRAAAVRAA